METYECLKKLNFRAFLLLMQNLKKKKTWNADIEYSEDVIFVIEFTSI